MRFRVSLFVLALLAAPLGSLVLVARAEGEEVGVKAPADKKAAPALPSDAILAVYDSLTEALKQIPRAVLLSPEKFQKMTEDLDRLRKRLDQLEQAQRQLGLPPSSVVIEGKIENNLALLTAQYKFATEKARERIALACGLARPTGIHFDGTTPRLGGGRARVRPSDPPARADEADGYFIEIDKVGNHELSLDLMAPVSALASTQSLVLDLPRAAITKIDVELPPDSRDPRITVKPTSEVLLTFKNNRVSGFLGPAERVELTWRSGKAASASPVLEADGLIQVQLDNQSLTTKAALELRVLSGQTNQWRLQVPPKAELTIAPVDKPRVQRIEEKASLRIIHLKEPSDAPLQVLLTTTQSAPRPESKKPAGIGPFLVLGAIRQTGSILVGNSVADWHLELTPNGDLTRRKPTEDELRFDPNVTAFRYGPMAPAGSGGKLPGLSWLDVETESVHGQIKVKPAHTLTLSESEGGLRWTLRSELTILPRWADLDHFKVQLPAGWELNDDVAQPDRIRGSTVNKADGTVDFRLKPVAKDVPLVPFKVTVEAVRSMATTGKTPGQTSLGLPRVPGTIELDGTLVIQTPTNLELTPPDNPFAAHLAGLEPTRQTTHELAYRWQRRGPDAVLVFWRPYQPPVRVKSLVDLTIGPGEAQVRQELRYEMNASPPRLLVRVPSSANRLQVVEGGRLATAWQGAENQRSIVLSDPRKPVIVLEYSLPLPTNQNKPEPIALPLIAPVAATEGMTRVRVWCDAGSLPVAESDWVEQSIEEVPGKDRLPVLVLRSDRVDRPLMLRPGAIEPSFKVLIERSLVRVDLSVPGLHQYRVSYRVVRLAGRSLEIELPAPAPTINLQLSLDGKRLDYELAQRTSSEAKGLAVRVRLSRDLLRKPAILEVAYQLPPDRLGTTALTTMLQGPRIAGTPGEATRWLITAPIGQVVLGPESGSGSYRVWSRRGWLLAPRQGPGPVELERWLTGEPDSASTPEDDTAGMLVLWRDSGATVQLMHASEQTWLLVCSLGLVAIVLFWGRLALGGVRAANGSVETNHRSENRTPGVIWVIGGALVVGVLLLALARPGLMAQIAYGCQPGAGVLLVLLLFRLVVQERKRRQLVFLPSFTPASTRPPGSSINRSAGSRKGEDLAALGARAHGEPSTVDVPSREN